MLEPSVECSTPCHDGLDGHVDLNMLMSPCALPRISNFSGTPDAVMIYGMSVITAQLGVLYILLQVNLINQISTSRQVVQMFHLSVQCLTTQHKVVYI